MSAGVSTGAQLLDRIAANGVVGAGGAGFPTHVKLASRADCIILNAAECEPLLHKDKEILWHYPEQVLAGLTRASELVGAKEIVVGIKGKYAEVIDRLGPMVPPKGRIVPLSDTYPAGDEFILVYDVTGKIIPPGKIPPAVSCVVINVETAWNIGADTPVTEKFLTVAGAVRSPVTLRVPIGITVAEAVGLAGGATVANARALIGGVMMGQLASPDEPITKTCGGVIVLDAGHTVIRRYEAPWKTIARIGASACDQCSFCTEFCPRYLLGHPIEPHKTMRSLCFVESREPAVIGSQFCCECNLCTMMACPEDLDPKSVCVHGKRQLAAAGREWEAEAHPYRAELQLNNRRIPTSRLIVKLGLARFKNEGPLLDRRYEPERVILPLKQHAGAPARPVVVDGTQLEKGDVVAQPEDGALGAAIHASIAGTCRVTEDRVIITGS
ncbi:MAG: SLBB domain-containing protein [Phycisphaerales bacterium]|nr:MAG: SLBB domain-containing protein [Phycisphaerales bacterium]